MAVMSRQIRHPKAVSRSGTRADACRRMRDAVEDGIRKTCLDKSGMTSEINPCVAVTDIHVPADDGDTVFDKRWASEIIRITPEQIKALQAGSYIALDVQNEYIVYLELERAGEKP